jgi:predicted Zn-dependent peptidase
MTRLAHALLPFRFAPLLALPLGLVPRTAGAADPPADAAPEAATAASSIAALHFPATTRARLPNGLTIVLEENHQSPFVALQLRYAGGSCDEPAGKEGLAALTQRMMMMGTRHVPGGGYDATLDRIGATERGSSAGMESLIQSVTVPSNAVDSVLWLWSDQMGFFAPDDPKALLDARAASVRERDNKVNKVASGAVYELVTRAVYPEDHPYQRIPLGVSAESPTLEDVRVFHDENLGPNEATLVLVGDFLSAPMLERITTYVAPIPPAPARSAPRPAPAQLDEEIHLEVAANVKSPEVWMDWRTPPFFAAGDADLDAVARALVGQRWAALRWALVDQLHVATRVAARQMSHAFASDFRITATVAPGHTTSEVASALDGALGTLRKQGLSEVAIAAGRAEFAVTYLQDLDRAARRAHIYGELAAAHRDATGLLGDFGRIDALTTASVNETIARWLPRGHRVITFVTPDASAPLAGVLRATRGAK